MFSRWWRSRGFSRQAGLVVAASFAGIVALVEVAVEPLVREIAGERLRLDGAACEAVLWGAGVLFPAVALGSILTRLVERKTAAMAKMADRLSRGDLAARIDQTGNGRDAFNRLGRAFNGMADSLERLLAHERRLLADISHELRSPLTRMGVAAALLSRKCDSGELKPLIQALDDEITGMTELVAALLKQGGGRLEGEAPSWVALSELVRAAAAAQVPVAESGGKSLALDIEPGLAVRGRPARIRLILDNILANALFHSPGDGVVRLALRRDGDRILLSVRDHGPGVPERHLRDIFRAFFRVDRSRAGSGGGVGLGLALVRDAAVAMGGSVEARNAGPGLEIIVSLPPAGPDGGEGNDARFSADPGEERGGP